MCSVIYYKTNENFPATSGYDDCSQIVCSESVFRLKRYIRYLRIKQRSLQLEEAVVEVVADPVVVAVMETVVVTERPLEVADAEVDLVALLLSPAVNKLQ